MARVSFVEKEQAHPFIKEVYQSQEEQNAQVLNLLKVMAHCPWIGRNFMRLGNSILRGEELPARLRELAILCVGKLLKAEYEFTHHIPLALQAGVNKEQIDQLAKCASAKVFNKEEQAVLRYAEELTKNVSVSDDTFEELRNLFSERSIVELTAAIGYYNMACRILVGLQIEFED
jgi:4-carboxymuconolactone decarboxylase